MKGLYNYIKGSINISAHLSKNSAHNNLRPNLVSIFVGNNLFDPNYAVHPNYFMVRTKLGYLRYFY